MGIRGKSLSERGKKKAAIVAEHSLARIKRIGAVLGDDTPWAEAVSLEEEMEEYGLVRESRDALEGLHDKFRERYKLAPEQASKTFHKMIVEQEKKYQTYTKGRPSATVDAESAASSQDEAADSVDDEELDEAY